MELTPDQQTTFLYDAFLKASGEPDLRPADEATLLAQVEGWKGGLFIDAVQKTVQQRQLKSKAPTKKNLMQRLFKK